jgi:hypothetical protein
MNIAAAGQYREARATAKTARLLGNRRPPLQAGAARNVKFER